ncbi:PREDICTED: uncharacterized protein LOC105969828 [Erythranthe guttata]|uniref:uncharacterized protein LOC105969828 n=1 Tax=Erythranthe guttata TaxID=4155 RepID=UPI00064E1099|nr:PREDICTED: uncharacterized protein LOC105969828 [Erythranthe guttata]|eukprot:XP_012850059.1 PREDICTED: uncharacterized protein LOC105969828 [Erythranthe guttata]
MYDKGWVRLNRVDPEYEIGASKFVEAVIKNLGNPEMILCPCIDCRNVDHQSGNIVVEHLVTRGMDIKYKQRNDWYEHGEQMTSGERVDEIVNNEAFNLYKATHYLEEDYVKFGEFVNEDYNEPMEGKPDDSFMANLKDAETLLYSNGSRYNKLSAIVTLFRLKTHSGWSDTSFNELLGVLADLLPEDNVLPKSLYLMKKFLKEFGMGYEKIHACSNDCCLFRNEYKDMENCPKCGPKQPGNDIDVYLQPLIEDLQTLWHNGVEASDAFSKTIFNLRAILLWTINDFPAYGNLAGCCTKGKMACPLCGKNKHHQWLKYSRKFAYMGHRKFLPPSHSYRRKKSWFDNNIESGSKPRILTGRNIFSALEKFPNNFGKLKKQKRKRNENVDGDKDDEVGNDTNDADQDELVRWKKRSIFFDLPYWKELPLRHNLDVMHVEKNVCESLISTILHCGKSRDGVNARKDLENMQIRKDLYAQPRGSKTYLPAAPWTLSKSEKKNFCERLYNFKGPDGYCSNIGKCVSLEECKVIGLKSHDYHTYKFDLDEEWQKAIVLKSMGCIWRASKSRLVKQIRDANNEADRLKLQPRNIHTRAEWRKFIKEKTSPAFKTISERYKAIRHKQISHTCSRKGMARLAEDMEKLNELESESPSSSRTDIRNDSLSKVLGQDKYGRVRGMGRGMTITKLSLFLAHNKHVSHMENWIKQLENIVSALGKNKVHQSEEADKTSSKGGNSNFGPDCKLVDWGGTNDIVAEGRVVSFDPKDLVDQIPLGPNAIKVLVNVPIQPNAFLWRPTPNMTFIKESRGKTIAWHSERVILQSEEESGEEENYNFVASIDAKNKCKLLDWNGKDEVVAEGRLHSSDPNALVNGIPLRPNAMIVSVDVPKFFEACLWRPLAADMRFIKDVVNSTIAWPADRVILEKTVESEEENISSPQVKKCVLVIS